MTKALVRARAILRTGLDDRGLTRIETIRSDPPLTLRQTAPGEVHLVSTGAGPLGGDHLRLDVEVAEGTSLTVRSIASTLVLPGAGRSLMEIHVYVASGATLVFAPEPTVLAAGCDHRMTTAVTLAADASLFWREEIVFGRHGERPGRCHSRFDATAGGRPLLRQEFVVGDPEADGSPAVFGTARCVGSTLITTETPAEGPKSEPREAEVAEGVAVLPLAGPGTLVSALAADAVELRKRLSWGESRVSVQAGSPARATVGLRPPASRFP
ncbi:urease accessory protein UreD [Herbidospora sp. NEAU-GS84]|uniref:Urease accessory protein UreD n=1 Tax=Herbidospora solisilvae TaxID=2696284 RepID=A0A7C9N7G3_9ACTN|nr:urease accessory protein UreD [Herbidospora solisilvae]NAS23093.1 urease accessory protein UreD [Herbidospora solisilvae]